MNGLVPASAVLCVVRTNMDNDIFYVLYNYLEERHHNNIYQNAKQDADYLKFSQQEQKFRDQYDNLDLSDEQRKVINHWIDAIHAQDEAYTAVVFRMAMQCCFALLLERKRQTIRLTLN